MKRLILPAALLFAVAGTLAQAQQAPAPAPSTDVQQPAPVVREHAANPHKEAMRMTRELNLTPDQTAKVEPILADREQKVAAIRSNTTLAPKDAHKQMKAVHEASEDQLATILTPDQLTQLKSMHKGHKGKGDTQPLAPPATTPNS